MYTVSIIYTFALPRGLQSPEAYKYGLSRRDHKIFNCVFLLHKIAPSDPPVYPGIIPAAHWKLLQDEIVFGIKNSCQSQFVS